VAAQQPGGLRILQSLFLEGSAAFKPSLCKGGWLRSSREGCASCEAFIIDCFKIVSRG